MTGLYIEVSVKPHVELFVEDWLGKAEGAPRPGHKYLRRWKHGDTWRYIYEEPGHKNRQEFPQEAIDAMRELGKIGNRRARLLVENIKERDPKTSDALDAPLFGPNRQRVIDAIKMALGEVIRPIQGNSSSEFGRRYNRAGLNYVEMQQNIHGDTLREILGSFGEVLTPIETAMAGIDPATSANSAVRESRGYPNAIYMMALRQLEHPSPSHGSGLVPRGYSQTHRRGENLTKFGEFESRRAALEAEIAAREQVRQQEERRVAAERLAHEQAQRAETIRQYEGTVLHGIIMHMAQQPSVAEIQNIKASLSRLFPGKDLKEEDFPYKSYEREGVKVVINRLTAGGDMIGFEMAAFDPNGNQITTSWSRSWSRGPESGNPARGIEPGVHISNSLLFTDPRMRGAARIGELVNDAQYAFLQKYCPNNGEVEVHAAAVGCYNWTNLGFSFISQSSLISKRRGFREFAAHHGITLSEADMLHFTEPCHFSAFDDGHLYEISGEGGQLAPLTKKQLDSASLSGKEGEIPLTPEEISLKKSRRMMVHLGKKFMLGNHWDGMTKTSRMTDENEAWKFYKNYRRLRGTETSPTTVLNPGYQSILSRTKGAMTGPRNITRTTPMPTPAPRPVSATPIPSPIPLGSRSSVPRPTTRTTRSGRTRSGVTRPRGFEEMPSSQQQAWYSWHAGSLSATQSRSTRQAIQHTRLKTIEARRKFGRIDGPLGQRLVENAPDGLLSGNIPDFTTMPRANRDIANNLFLEWTQEATSEINSGSGTTEDKQQLRKELGLVTKDYQYRIKNPPFHMSRAEREEWASRENVRPIVYDPFRPSHGYRR